MKTVEITLPILISGVQGIDLMRRLGNRTGGLPFTVTLDAAGRVRERKLGAYTAAELKAGLDRLLR